MTTVKLSSGSTVSVSGLGRWLGSLTNKIEQTPSPAPLLRTEKGTGQDLVFFQTSANPTAADLEKIPIHIRRNGALFG